MRLHRWLHAASSLHQNFYEDWLDTRAVRVEMDDIARLVGGLESIPLTRAFGRDFLFVR